MSKHLFGMVVTGYGVAANNRGENDGNITTLQKLLWQGQVHTTVSAEAIRWAIRYYWQRSGLPVNRVWDDDLNDHRWQDPDWTAWAESRDEDTFIDDDVLGYMRADAAKEEGNEAEEQAEGRSRRPRAKGTALKRRGRLEVTRAVSLTPFAGDITFNARSGVKGSTSLYGTEMHATRYQYGFALTPESLRIPARALKVLDAVAGLTEVAGNQSRFLFDFSPESILLRWTDDMAPRFLYAFEMDESGEVRVPRVIERVRAGDIAAEELVVAGRLADTPDGEELRRFGATVVPGIKTGVAIVQERMRKDLGIGE